MKEFGLFKILTGAAIRVPGNTFAAPILALISAIGMSACMDPVGKMDDSIVTTIEKKFVAPIIVSPASAVTPTAATVVANGIATASVTVTLVDVTTSAPVAGKTVTLTSSRTAGLDTISAASGLSDATGVVTFTVTSTTVGTAVFSASDTDDTILIVPTATVTWASGAVTSIAFTTQPSTTGNADTALAQQPIITAYDVNNNPVVNLNNAITLTAYSDAACTAAVASGLSATTNPVNISAAGVATFAGVKGLKTNVIRIGAAAGAIKTCSSALAISPGATATLTVSNFTSPATAGTNYNFHVTALDANSNITPAYVGTVTFTSSDGAAVLPGNYTFTTGGGGDNGFNNGFNAALKTVGGGTQTITATDTITGSITGSQTITVVPGAIASLAFSTQPSATGTANTVLATQPIITAYDSSSNIVTTNSSASITMTPYSDACVTSVAAGMGATTNPATLSSGAVTFAGVKAIKTSVVRFGVSDGTHTACSNAVAISAGAIASIAFSAPLPSTSGNTDTALASQPIISAYDANSNIVTNNSAANITMTAYSDACSTAVGSGMSATTNPVTLSNGIATFAGVKVLKTSVIHLGVSDGTHTACSATMTISPGVASVAKSTLTIYPGSIVADGATTGAVTITILDANSNPRNGDTVTLTSSRGGTDTIATVSGTTNASGVATFTVKSSTTGNPTLTAADTISLTRKILFLSQTPAVDFQPWAANSGTAIGDTTVTAWWKDLFQSNTANDFGIHNFPNPNTAWSGTGLSTDATTPYQLAFSSGSSQYLQSSTTLNGTNGFYFETWVKPTSNTTNGSVILNNADLTGGFQLKQSNQFAGQVELQLTSATSYADTVIADSPVSLWKMNEPNGLTMADSIGTNPGVYNASNILGASHSGFGDGGTALNLNAAATPASIASAASLNFGTGDFSVEFWINVASRAGNTEYGIINKNSTFQGTPGWGFEASSWGQAAGQYAVIFYNTNQVTWGNTNVSVTALNINQWYHIVGTRSGTTIKIYKNAGVPVTITHADAALTVTNALAVNLGLHSWGPALPASLDEIAVYNTALTAGQITAHYNAASVVACRSISSLANNTWNFISGLYSHGGNSFKLFVNGTQECSQSVTINTSGSASPLTAGASNVSSTPANYWSGSIAEARAMNTDTATNANVVSNFNAESGNYPTVFVPTSIAGLQLWLDATDTSTTYKTIDCTTTAATITNDLVKCWKDKSGHGLNATQGTVAQTPALDTAGINNKSTVRFGASAWNELVTASINLSARTYFVVTRYRAAQYGSYARIIMQGTPFSNLLTHSGNWGLYQGGFNDSTVAEAGNQLLTGTINSTTSLRINGTQVFNFAASASAINTPFEIGGYSINPDGLNGDIAELLVFDSQLSESNIKKVEAYLNAKWNLY